MGVTGGHGEGGEVGLSYSKKVYQNHNHFYPGQEAHFSDNETDDELQKRRKAQAELEREEAEVKRNIKSLMRMTPESRAMEDPALADRVRNTRYEP